MINVTLVLIQTNKYPCTILNCTNPPKKQAVCPSLELLRQFSTSPSNRSWTLKPTTTSTAAEDCTSYPMTYDLKTRRQVFT